MQVYKNSLYSSTIEDCFQGIVRAPKYAVIVFLLSNGDISWWLELQVNGSALRLADGLHLKGMGGVDPVRLKLEHCTGSHHRICTHQNTK